MSQRTSIGWCIDPRTGEQGHSWGVVRGCSRVSPGCTHCYGERMAQRFCGFREAVTQEPGLIGTTQPLPFFGFADQNGWTGRVELIESKLEEPLKRKKPTLYFVNSMSDLFHEALLDDDIDRVFATMALCPQHLFLVLTKRARQMHRYMTAREIRFGPFSRKHGAEAIYSTPHDKVFSLAREISPGLPGIDRRWPLPNVWLGVSAEDQQRANERIPWLLRTPAALRFVSLEPLLSAVDIKPWLPRRLALSEIPGSMLNDGITEGYSDGLSWAIAGGESGPKARPMNPDWPRRVVQDCKAAGVPVFVKQLMERGRKIPFAEWPTDLQVQEMPEVEA